MGAFLEEEPVSLRHIFNYVKSPRDVPGVSTPFDLEITILTTLFEFYSIGRLHDNLHLESILFRLNEESGDEVDVRKPHLVGFDLLLSNQPGDITEKPNIIGRRILIDNPTIKAGRLQASSLCKIAIACESSYLRLPRRP